MTEYVYNTLVFLLFSCQTQPRAKTCCLKAGGLSLRLFTENNEGLAFVLIVNTRFLDSLPIKLRQLSWRGFILNLQV